MTTMRLLSPSESSLSSWSLASPWITSRTSSSTSIADLWAVAKGRGSEGTFSGMGVPGRSDEVGPEVLRTELILGPEVEAAWVEVEAWAEAAEAAAAAAADKAAIGGQF